MEEENKSLDNLSKIEKAVNEMATFREQIADLKAWENDRQLAMKTLQATEKNFKALVENIPQRIYMKDRDSVYVFCNEKYAAGLKIKAEDITGKTDYEFFPKELAEKYGSEDKGILSTGQLQDIEEEYVHEGQTFMMHTVKTPVKDEKGEAVGILGIFWDITEQKRKEEELRKKSAHLEELVSNRAAEVQAVNEQLQREIAGRQRLEQRLQKADAIFWTFFENTGTASVMVEENMIIFLANREFEKLSGFSKVEMEGKKSLSEFLTPDDIENIKGFNLTGRTSLDTVLSDYECPFNGREGNRRHIRITAVTVPGGKKAVVSLLDITDLKGAQESLRILQAKNQALGENTHDVEHDLLVKCEFQAIQKQKRISSPGLLRNLFTRKTEGDRKFT
jgi:PAS domain S-box-containing protein